MNHVMIDIETLGTNNNAPILNIGAAFFDPYTGSTGDEFSQGISLQSAIDAGAVPDAKTIEWWMMQDSDARIALFVDPQPINETLRRFSYFLNKAKDNDLQIWANGPTFDLVILASAYRSIGEVAPWRFWNERCVRTLVELGRMRGFDPKRTMPFVGVAHDALDDVMHQIKYVSAIWQHVVGR